MNSTRLSPNSKFYPAAQLKSSGRLARLQSKPKVPQAMVPPHLAATDKTSCSCKSNPALPISQRLTFSLR